MSIDSRDSDAAGNIKVHFLDVGSEKYGDAVFCQFGETTVLIDGAHPAQRREDKDGHPSIPDQLGEILGKDAPYKISLLMVSHGHLDHIGCLPALIEEKIIHADWALVSDPDYAWGVLDGDAVDLDFLDVKQQQMIAALREEILDSTTDEETLSRFLDAAAKLRPTYTGMIKNLKAQKTRVVRLGRDSTSGILKAFDKVGLQIIGPARKHIIECAEVINDIGRDSVDRVADLFARDAEFNPVEAYRALVINGNSRDALDVVRHEQGAAINLQSIVTTFNYKGHKFLFAGDMQFVAPGVNNDFLIGSVAKLKEKVINEGPYSLVKLSHHGSSNAFDEEMLTGFQTEYFGICAGEKSPDHPNPKVLKLLDKHRDEITWARTDRNGLVSFSFGSGKPDITVTGSTKLNDARPNKKEDAALPEESKASSASLTQPEAQPQESVVSVKSLEQASAPGIVEVVTRIPHASTRVKLTIEIEPGSSSIQPSVASERVASRQGISSSSTSTASPDPGGPLPPLNIANGRRLPRLLFVTSKKALAENIGEIESAHVLKALRAQNAIVYDGVPDGLTKSAPAIELVRQQLRKDNKIEGVVLLGGHDVIPHQSVDCLPPKLRDRLTASSDTDIKDPDDFIVWSDEAYGDRDGDGWAEIPVSRISDGRSRELVFTAIQAGLKSKLERRTGLRNMFRPFADSIYTILTGNAPLLVSQPTSFDQTPPYDLQGDQVYFMLHGSDTDASRFWGEDEERDLLEAVNINNIPQQNSSVVFSGCCWGALTADTRASRVKPNLATGQKNPKQSMAMSFLMKGANAFVGCTGAHYSPRPPHEDHFGGPMHKAFWSLYRKGVPPAAALFQAKIEYAQDMPHGQRDLSARAIEYKILRQYTCLGLGW